MRRMKQYVIVGNSIAAVGCIEGIRREDRESPITVVSKEPYAVYGRPLISYYLEGKTDLERMKYRSDDFYEKNGCEVVYGQEATSIDPAKKTVSLSGGAEIPSDSYRQGSRAVSGAAPVRGSKRIPGSCYAGAAVCYRYPGQ